MTDLLVRDVRLRDEATGETSAVDVHVEDGIIRSIRGRSAEQAPAGQVIDGSGALLSPPYVEPHVHLDAVLTAGQPRWNESGTLWEGIACWSERKPMLTREDVMSRVEETLRWYV